MIIPAQPWTSSQPPKKVLVIRWQAMGDVVITLPYIQHLRNRLPATTKLDLLTRQETKDLPKKLELFDKVFAFGGERNFKKQLVHLSLFIPTLFLQRYDVVIDLQNNLMSRTLVKLLRPKAWSIFDKYSPAPAGHRYKATIEAVGLGGNDMDCRLRFKEPDHGTMPLSDAGWNQTDPFVVLNPAGAFETRNWPLSYYAQFARRWQEYQPNARFVIMGTNFIAAKADWLKNELGDRLFYLIGKTTPSEAFAVLQHASLVLSEDSGLMHMAWVGGTPTLALFGGTRSDWSRPLGEHSLLLGSHDLPCGNCMQEKCRHGDVHCLTRWTPEKVAEIGWGLYKKVQQLV